MFTDICMDIELFMENPYSCNNVWMYAFVYTFRATCLTHWGLDENRCQFPDNIFKFISLNKNVWISIKISLKFVAKGPIYR